MKQKIPQLLTLVFFFGLMAAFVLYKAGVFENKKPNPIIASNEKEVKDQYLFNSLAIDSPQLIKVDSNFYIDSTSIDWFLATSKSGRIFDSTDLKVDVEDIKMFSTKSARVFDSHTFQLKTLEQIQREKDSLEQAQRQFFSSSKSLSNAVVVKDLLKLVEKNDSLRFIHEKDFGLEELMIILELNNTIKKTEDSLKQDR